MHSDVDILYHTDSFAYSKRCAGFIPKTIFIKEPTASAIEKEEVIFFQDFGIPNPSELFISIDEAALPEITDADIYDVFNLTARWSYLRYLSGKEQLDIKRDPIKFLLENGFSVRHTKEKRPDNWWVPTWPAMIRLVEDPEPEWRSVDNPEAVARREERKRREDTDRAIARKCCLCATRKDLAIREGYFVHGHSYHRTLPCLAHEEHRKRDTIAHWLTA